MSISTYERFVLPVSLAETTSAGPIEIVRVQSRREIAEFIELPKRLFRNLPCWVDPLDAEEKRFLSDRHPFRLHGQAVCFLATRGRQVVGRIMASDDPHFNRQHGTNVGCFGKFHTINDQQVANQLLDAAAGWLVERGRGAVLGPIGYSTNYSAGLLIDGLNTPPRFLMNHNPDYYQQLLRQWGLRKATDLYAWWFTRDNAIDDKWRSVVDRLGKRYGVVIRPIRMKQFDQEVKLLRNLYNEAWQDNWGFVKMSTAEFEAFANGLRKFAVSEMMLIAEVEQKPVGLAITMPDLNEAIAPLHGRLTRLGLPTGLAKLLMRMRKIRTARLAALGVLPGYRRRGVAEMLIQRTFDYGKDVLGYTGAELGWTLEDNEMINRSIRRVGGRCYKTYRIFRKELVPGSVR